MLPAIKSRQLIKHSSHSVNRLKMCPSDSTQRPCPTNSHIKFLCSYENT